MVRYGSLADRKVGAYKHPEVFTVDRFIGSLGDDRQGAQRARLFGHNKWQALDQFVV